MCIIDDNLYLNNKSLSLSNFNTFVHILFMIEFKLIINNSNFWKENTSQYELSINWSWPQPST